MTFANFSRIATDITVCGGRSVVKGTRLRVIDLLDMLAGGASEAEIVADFPIPLVKRTRLPDVRRAVGRSSTMLHDCYSFVLKAPAEV